jgi:hypothetical protein
VAAGYRARPDLAGPCCLNEVGGHLLCAARRRRPGCLNEVGGKGWGGAFGSAIARGTTSPGPAASTSLDDGVMPGSIEWGCRAQERLDDGRNSAVSEDSVRLSSARIAVEQRLPNASQSTQWK